METSSHLIILCPLWNFLPEIQFFAAGRPQIIVKINTKDGKVALASFMVSVLLPSPTNIAIYGIYNH